MITVISLVLRGARMVRFCFAGRFLVSLLVWD